MNKPLMILLAATATFTSHAETIFTDGTFDPADWSLTLYQQGSGGTVSTSQEVSGGNPDHYRRIVNTVNSGVPHSSVLAFHRRHAAVYAPQTQGAIGSIDYSEDWILVTGFGDGQRGWPALEQAGQVYLGSSFLTPAFVWTNEMLTHLSAEAFSMLDASSPTMLDTNRHPDFSTNGPPITFGFARANSTASAGTGYTITGGIDNWMVTVRPPAAQPLLKIVSLTQDGLLTWTNHPPNLYCGLLHKNDLLDECWRPAPGAYWNFLTSNSVNTLQMPIPRTAPSQVFFKLVCSTSPLVMDLPQYTVPIAQITVDGDTNDWAGIQPAIVDRLGEAQEPAGSDIARVYLAVDTTNAYVRIDVANGPPATNMYYGFSSQVGGTADVGDTYVFVDVGRAECGVGRWLNYTGDSEIVASGTMAIQGNVIEVCVSLADLAPPQPSYAHAWCNADGPPIDRTCTIEVVFP